jgi:predicted regulator of Ras-like GTPase activity (Roadblock/LC7/MglB family)
MSSGKRYSKEEKAEIMQYRQTHTYKETADKYSVSQMTLARWSRNYKTFLKVLKYLEGVKSVALFSIMTDGSAVASISDNNISEDVLFLNMTAVLSAAGRSSEELGLGTLDMLMSKCREGLLLIQGINPNLLVIMIYGGKVDVQKIVNQDFPFIDRVRLDILSKFENLLCE